MTTIIIIALFLLQIISFYFIALLNMKLSKYKDLEDRQEQTMKEIEDSFSAYLADMKDENDRLLYELKENSFVPPIKEHASAKEEVSTTIKNDIDSSFVISRPLVSKHKVANSYVQAASLPEKKQPVTMKEKVLYYSEEGKSPIEIAKLLQIGKTEVELFLKFK
ncbi:hypothetical protein MKY09_12565 [Psychrobacillus sp. FSL K6-4046]|uniref:DUF6115 domain-containing protein n=1 Tax=Psychrobacillus sp. FSL K6-4046 TaxID=2921550 RepID=UPI00315A8B2E